MHLSISRKGIVSSASGAKKQKDFRDEMKKRQLEISRLRKVATKNQYKINQLTSQKKQSDKLLKARATQINPAQKQIRKLTMRKLGTNRGRNANKITMLIIITTTTTTKGNNERYE